MHQNTNNGWEPNAHVGTFLDENAFLYGFSNLVGVHFSGSLWNGIHVFLG
jgi:hypothetical protein